MSGQVTNHPMRNVSLPLSLVASFYIIQLNDLIRFRNISSVFADVIDKYSDDTWLRFIDINNLCESIHANFLPIYRKASELKLDINIFACRFQALEYRKYAFLRLINSVFPVQDFEIKPLLFSACHFGAYDVVSSILKKDSELSKIYLDVFNWVGLYALLEKETYTDAKKVTDRAVNPRSLSANFSTTEIKRMKMVMEGYYEFQEGFDLTRILVKRYGLGLIRLIADAQLDANSANDL